MLFPDIEGRTLSLAALRGKVVLLNFWAAWCAPCVEELPSLARLRVCLAEPAFALIALALDRQGRELVEPFLGRLGVRDLPVYLDPTLASMRAVSPRGLPITRILEQDGREIGRLDGAAKWDSDEGAAFVRYFLKRHGGS
ncbi:MAG: TlpA disulfide reductase family protein [Pseudomonadota bacterium]